MFTTSPLSSPISASPSSLATRMPVTSCVAPTVMLPMMPSTSTASAALAAPLAEVSGTSRSIPAGVMIQFPPWAVAISARILLMVAQASGRLTM